MALSNDLNYVEQEGKLLAMPMAAEKIFKGSLVKVNANGFAAKCAVEAGATFAGIAIETVDNSAGAAGAKTIRVQNVGSIELAIASAAQSNVGDKVYGTADDTITFTEGSDKKPIVGVMVGYISSTKILVRLTPFLGTGA